MKRNIYEFYKFNTDIFKIVEQGLKLIEEFKKNKVFEIEIKNSDDVFLSLMIINSAITENKKIKIKLELIE